MGRIELKEAEKEYLRTERPTLIYDVEQNTVAGILSYDLAFAELDNYRIKDSYEIKIFLSSVSKEGLPLVYETGNRILGIAKAKEIPFHDLHLNNQLGEMCIIIPPKVSERYPDGFELKRFIEHIEEHLFWISYFEITGQKPWPDIGHGHFGYLDLYLEDKEKYGAQVKKYFDSLTEGEFDQMLQDYKKTK